MYDLTVRALTPGQPEVLVAANVTAAAADKLVRRLLTVQLADDVRLVPHVPQLSTSNVSERNEAYLEVLLAVLERREAAAAQVGA